MSEKTDIIELLNKARTAHLAWRTNAENMVCGMDVAEESVPVEHTRCEFGKWFYAEGKGLLGHLDVYQLTDSSHRVLHAVYREIHDLAQQGKIELAKAKLTQLIETSVGLLESLDMLEQEVMTLPD